LVHTCSYSTAEVAELFSAGRPNGYRAIERQRREAHPNITARR
jgi:hypothetical protein